MYKLSHNLVHIMKNIQFLIVKTNEIAKAMPISIDCQNYLRMILSFLFLPESISEGNSLPSDLVNSKSLADFKSKLEISYID